jgi:hypothetical protein
MPRLITAAVTLIWGFAGIAMISCEQSPTVPSHVGTVDQLVQSLRGQGLAVSLGGEISPNDNGFFSVPARKVSIDGQRLSAFEYATAERAAADAALISVDGQPNPRAAITWVSTPRFYRQGRLIVLYVGCATEVIAALEQSLGPPMVTGPTPCR